MKLPPMRLVLAVLLSLTSLSVRADTASEEKDLLGYLDQSITWYRHVTAAEASNISSREVLLRDTLQQSALKSLRYSFDFARIQAAYLQKQVDAADAEKKEEMRQAADQAKTDAVKPEEGAKPDDTSIDEKKFNPEQAKISISDKADGLQKQIAAVDAQISRATRSQRETLAAKRDKLNAELNLTKTQSDLVDAIIGMSTSEKQETITGQVENLAKALPELNKKTVAPAAAPSDDKSADAAPNPAMQLLAPGLPAASGSAAPASDAAPESKGVIRLIGDLMTRTHQKQELADLFDETQTMRKTNEGKISEQRDRLIGIIKRSKDLSDKTEGANADALAQQGQELTDLNDDFKRVSDYLVPLSKQRLALTNASQTIQNWQSIFNDEMGQIFRRLLGRILTLAVLLAVPLGISELVRRGLSQYVRDARRRRQLNIIRLIVVGVIIGIIILLNLMTEFGSMATFIGFVTAGLAVALQNVILSIVAYFFFFGRFGVKVGSRVTIGAVTGDVIETGFVRLYLMELAEEKGQMRPTGRIVAFPNSIIFQPLAFFKQVPGVNYRWHEITYVLAPDTERKLAEAKLREITESVYKDNKGMIDMQKAALEQSTRLRVKEPRPDGRIEKTPEGLSMIIRYPVDVEQAETTDKNVMRQVGEIFERLPSVKRLDDEPPAVKRK